VKSLNLNIQAWSKLSF